VLEGDSCIGHVSEGTVTARVLERPSLLDSPVSELMDAPLPIVDTGADLPSVTRTLNRHTPAVLVREGGELAGIITRGDVLKYVAG
jgi:cystathionine beta-synthase